MFLNTLFTFLIRFGAAVLLVLPNIGLTGEMVNQSLAVEKNGLIYIDIPRGHIKVVGWDKAEVMVQGELDDTSKQLTFTNQQEKTLIKLNTEEKKYWGDASELTIFMPKTSLLRFKGIDTGFDVSKLISDIEGKTISGDLTVSKSTGKITLSVVSGDVKILQSSGLAKIQSVSGMVDFSGDFEQVFIKSMSGDVKADISGAEKLALKSVSGDLKVTGLVKSNAQIKLTTVNGDISYRVDNGLDAKCELISQFGGDIDNQLTDDLPTEASLHKKTLSFVSGQGLGTITMNTVTGSITIKKMEDDELTH